jgi:hypothetical protein
MITTIIAGLILSAISGLAVLAYKEPKFFDKLPLISCLATAYVGITAWDTAIDIVYAKFLPYIQKSQTATVQNIATRLHLGPSAVLVCAGLLIYFGFLGLLSIERQNKP